jgi:hypothetical protein
MSRQQPNLDGRYAQVPTGCLYIDESYSDHWQYIGVLVVPDNESDALLAVLEEGRKAAGYFRELHFHKITTEQKRALASRWLAYAQCPGSPPVRFHVVGVDLDKINYNAFGDTAAQRKQNMYRRFLNMALDYAIRAYLPSDCNVRAIVHDHRTLMATEAFHRMTPAQLRLRKLRVHVDALAFVDSDHEKSGEYRDSTFIQLIDSIVGVSRLCLDATSQKAHQLRLARQWLPMLERMTDDTRRNNRYSRYGHGGRCSIVFFPEHRLTDAELHDPEQRVRAGLYWNRTPLLSTQDNPTLFA